MNTKCFKFLSSRCAAPLAPETLKISVNRYNTCWNFFWSKSENFVKTNPEGKRPVLIERNLCHLVTEAKFLQTKIKGFYYLLKLQLLWLLVQTNTSESHWIIQSSLVTIEIWLKLIGNYLKEGILDQGFFWDGSIVLNQCKISDLRRFITVQKYCL